MSVHQLQAMTLGDPRAVLLKELYENEVSLPDALGRLVSFHLADSQHSTELRTVTVSGNDRFFPHHFDVPALLIHFFQKLHGLWESCESHRDDLYVSAFAIYGILAIHPFENANGRTSVDLGQLLLMKRWDIPKPPLALPKDAHRLIAGIVASLDAPCDGETPEAFYALRRDLTEYIEQISVEKLKQTKEFQIVTNWLQLGIQEQ